MISKRVKRHASKSDIRRLVGYILDINHSSSEVLWMSSDEYQASNIEGKKLGCFKITNCEATVPGMAMAEMVATQKKNTRAKTDKVYHLVISFPKGEYPTESQLEDIEKTFSNTLGFAAHQRISALHQDTENLHLHLAINKINPHTFKCLEPYNDYFTRDKVCRDLEIKHNLIVDNHGKQRTGFGNAANIEVHADKDSFLRWVRETAGQTLQENYETGEGWQIFHECLAKFDLEVKMRGAGLVICQKGGGIAVKASSVSPVLSFLSLTTRWGEFEPLKKTSHSIYPIHKYQKSLRHSNDDTEQLYNEYKEKHHLAISCRKVTRTCLKNEYAEYLKKMKDWYAEHRKNIKQNPLLSREEKRIAYKGAFAEYRRQWAEWNKKIDFSRKAVTDTIPLVTWVEFLISKAEVGDKKALLVLRRKRLLRGQITDCFISAEEEGGAITLSSYIHDKVKHQIGKRGEVTYNLIDGGKVVDEGKFICVDVLTKNSVFLALTLAEKLFKGRPLIVEGSYDFKKQILAAAEKYHVAFADEWMEKERQNYVQDQGYVKNGSTPLENYIVSRNAFLGKVSDIIPHREWCDKDVGIMVYQGKRKLSDDSFVILLRYREEILVKLAGEIDVDKMSQRYRVGDSLVVDKNGHYNVEVSKQR